MAALAAGDADQARTYRLLGLNTTARYVRITVEPASSAWSFTDEPDQPRGRLPWLSTAEPGPADDA